MVYVSLLGSVREEPRPTDTASRTISRSCWRLYGGRYLEWDARPFASCRLASIPAACEHLGDSRHRIADSPASTTTTSQLGVQIRFSIFIIVHALHTVNAMPPLLTGQALRMRPQVPSLRIVSPAFVCGCLRHWWLGLLFSLFGPGTLRNGDKQPLAKRLWLQLR